MTAHSLAVSTYRAVTDRPYSSWQTERDELGGMIHASNRHDDVLLSLVHVGHRRPCGAGFQFHLPTGLAGCFVERPDLAAASAGRCSYIDLIAFGREQQRLRHKC